MLATFPRHFHTSQDDDLAVELVTSASNLRSICYDIPVQVKGEVGGSAKVTKGSII